MAFFYPLRRFLAVTLGHFFGRKNGDFSENRGSRFLTQKIFRYVGGVGDRPRKTRKTRFVKKCIKLGQNRANFEIFEIEISTFLQFFEILICRPRRQNCSKNLPTYWICGQFKKKSRGTTAFSTVWEIC